MYIRFVVRAFFGNRSLVLLILPFVLVAFYLLNLLTEYYTPAESISLGWWGQLYLNPNISSVLALSLVLFQSININTVFNRNEFMERNTYFVAFIYTLFLAQFELFYGLCGLGIALFLCGQSVFQILKLNQNEDGRRNVFNASLFLGLAATFFPPLIVLFPFMITLIWILRPFVFREFIITLIGLSLPFIYVTVYYFFSDQNFEFYTIFKEGEIVKNIHHVLTFIVIMVLIFLSCLGLIFKKLRQSSIRLKKMLRVLTIIMFGALALGLLQFVVLDELEGVALSVIPVSFLITFGFGEREPEQLSELLTYVLFIFSCAKFFLPLTYSLPEIF